MSKYTYWFEEDCRGIQQTPNYLYTGSFIILVFRDIWTHLDSDRLSPEMYDEVIWKWVEKTGHIGESNIWELK